MESKEWLVPSAPGYVSGDVTRRQRASLRQILGTGMVWGIELLESALPERESEIFLLYVQQPLLPSDFSGFESKHQFSSLGILFKQDDVIAEIEETPIRCHLRMDFVMGMGFPLRFEKFIKGFIQEDEKRLSNLLGRPIDGLWFDNKNNNTILCFQDEEKKQVLSLVFDANINKKNNSICLKWSYFS